MSGFRIPEFLLGCLLALAAVGVFAIFSSGHGWDGWLLKDASGFFTCVTAIVAAFQAYLFVRQLDVINRSIEPALAGAEAARLSAEAVIASERAYLFVEVAGDIATVVVNEHNARTSRQLPVRASFSFENYGKTPAVIRSAEFGAITSADLPAEREYYPIIHLPNRILGSGKRTGEIVADGVSIHTSEAAAIHALDTTFWFYGNVVYDDSFRWRRTLNFVWHYSPISGGFTLFSYDEREERVAAAV